MANKRTKSRKEPDAPQCGACGRPFASAFELPSFTVEDVQRHEVPDDVRDSMVRGANVASEARGVVALPCVKRYLQEIEALVGKTVLPARLRPSWDRSTPGHHPTPIPGVGSTPSGDWTQWALGFSTEWLAEKKGAVVAVELAVRGHSLGRYTGEVLLPLVTLAEVRIKASDGIDREAS